MALDGLMALVCAGAVLAADPADSASPSPGTNRDSAVATTLAVQTALQQGREHLFRGDYRAAVNVLESQLTAINGNRVYLNALQDAYRGYVRELRLSKQDEEAQRYLQRLLILDRGAILDSTLSRSNSSPPAQLPPPAAKPAASPPAKATPTVRLMRDEEDAFHASRAIDQANPQARTLLAEAENQFQNCRYSEARLFYEQAHQADAGIMETCREHWAYCKLFHVVEQINQSTAGMQNWPGLEKEVKRALELAPQTPGLQKEGVKLLIEIEKRQRGEAAAPESKGEAPAAVRHFPRNAKGWFIAESENFRVFHKATQTLAEKTIQAAEQTRATRLRQWFGGVSDPWNPKCDLYLHATAQDYGQATGQDYHSPGHSTLKLENGRLVIRRMDLHCDEPTMLVSILPHETTHVVLADQFGGRLLPRWADEGMAILSEPRDRVEQYLKNLAKYYQDGQLFKLRELIEQSYQPQQEGYPEPRRVGAFYAQSVSLVDFLTSRRGPHEFTLFLHDGFRYGYEKALQRHYGYRSYAELEQQWGAYAFRERTSLKGVAERPR
jgi:hypothetical protein